MDMDGARHHLDRVPSHMGHAAAGVLHGSRRTGDTVALVALVVWYRKGEGSDSRLEFGATGLLKMMGKRAVVALPASGSMPSEMTNLRLRHLKDDLELTSSDERFIFHPSNPQYILRDGCPK
jgi:hypothetical protein